MAWNNGDDAVDCVPCCDGAVSFAFCAFVCEVAAFAPAPDCAPGCVDAGVEVGVVADGAVAVGTVAVGATVPAYASIYSMQFSSNA